jgi:hypothetical protein
MTDPTIRLDEDAAALRAAAERLHEQTLDPACGDVARATGRPCPDPRAAGAGAHLVA